ncbi:G2/M phase-specific E3 ubiquitin-protein ligase-like [Centruroides vittatus]|uniref:G2/M phase-specific E3 ubiquitin-protein ligase-like n=1 Tax=Centruroides vittatus TaxID=120091 RepID=UPI003510314E
MDTITEFTNLEKKKCMLCMSSYENDLQYGEMKTLNDITVHYYCLLLATDIEQHGDDDEGILGFLPHDIHKVIKKGRRTKCAYCELMGATIYCIIKKCPNVFHLICGLQQGTLHQYFGQFKSYCHIHRPKQKVPPEYIKEDVKCLICLNNVHGFVSNDSLWPPCCKNVWFHRICIQKLALSTGYFFKCPLCNNVDLFGEAMKKQGIYIPSRDALWELEENAYSDLLFSYSRCDAVTCYCPKGRTYSSNESENGFWKLLLCETCGSQGCHRKCSNLALINHWECSNCREITQNMLPVKKKKKKRFHKKCKNIQVSGNSDECLASVISSFSTASSSSSSSSSSHNNNYSENSSTDDNLLKTDIVKDCIKVKEKTKNNNLSLPKITLSLKDFLLSHLISHSLIRVECSDDDNFDFPKIYESEMKQLQINVDDFEKQGMCCEKQNEFENTVSSHQILHNFLTESNNVQNKYKSNTTFNTYTCHPQNILQEMCASIVTNRDDSSSSSDNQVNSGCTDIIKISKEENSKGYEKIPDCNSYNPILLKRENSDLDNVSSDCLEDIEIIEEVKKPKLIEVIDMLDDDSDTNKNEFDGNEIIEVIDDNVYDRKEVFNIDDNVIEIIDLND